MVNQSELTRPRWWSREEDDKLRRQIINATQKLNWEIVARESGLERTANSCRLRWENHLKPGTRPDRKLTDEEKLLILQLRSQEGKNRWSKIAKHLLPGRRDNDVKNYFHTLAKRAKREGHDVELHAFLEWVELMDKIRAAGRFTMDYSSLIRPVAFNKLKELFPDLAVAQVAGSSSVTTGAVSSLSDHDLASSSAATDTGAASCYSVEFESEFSDVGPTAEVDQVILATLGYNPTEINNPEQLLNSGTLVHHGGGPTGFNQVPAAAAFNTTPNLGYWRKMIKGFRSEDFYDGRGPAEFKEATAAAFHNIL